MLSPLPSPAGYIQSHPTGESKNHPHLPMATSSPCTHSVDCESVGDTRNGQKNAQNPWISAERRCPNSFGGGYCCQLLMQLEMVPVSGCPLLSAASPLLPLPVPSPGGVKSDLQKTKEIVWRTHSGPLQMPAGLRLRAAQRPACPVTAPQLPAAFPASVSPRYSQRAESSSWDRRQVGWGIGKLSILCVAHKRTLTSP